MIRLKQLRTDTWRENDIPCWSWEVGGSPFGDPIPHLLRHLDRLTAHHYGDLDEALRTERAQELVEALLAHENRERLRDWYRQQGRLDSWGEEVRQILERESGEEL